MNRVESQAIEMIFGEPIEGIMNEEIPDGSTLGAIEVDSVAPRSVMTIGKELRRVRIKVVTCRAEVVVYNVE